MKGIAPECGRVQSKNSKLLCLQENRVVCVPQWLMIYRHYTEMILKILRMKISFTEDQSREVVHQLCPHRLVNYYPWACTGTPAGPMLYSARLASIHTGLNKYCHFTEFWRMLVSRMNWRQQPHKEIHASPQGHSQQCRYMQGNTANLRRVLQIPVSFGVCSICCSAVKLHCQKQCYVCGDTNNWITTFETCSVT